MSGIPRNRLSLKPCHGCERRKSSSRHPKSLRRATWYSRKRGPARPGNPLFTLKRRDKNETARLTMKVSLQEIIQQLDERPLSLSLSLSPSPRLLVASNCLLGWYCLERNSASTLSLSLSCSFSLLHSPRGPNEPLV